MLYDGNETGCVVVLLGWGANVKLCIFDESFGGRFRHSRSQLMARSVEASKVDGFFVFAREMARRLGVHVQYVQANAADLPCLIARHDADLTMFVPRWQNWHAQPMRLVEVLQRAKEADSRSKIVALDLSDSTACPFLDLLPYVDVLWKSQLFIDRSRYTDDIAGGMVIAEWVQAELGFSLGDWHFGSKGDPNQLDRLMCGWTMGVSRFYRRLAFWAKCSAKPWRRRKFDLNCRFKKPDRAIDLPWEWYHEYRYFAATRVEGLVGFHVGPSEPLSQLAYLQDLMKSRAVFSPFGWGEVCFRDYEAIACGCVLIKPDMSHLVCNPNIFVAGETYVPVAWDFSDLSERLQWVLDNPDEAERIIRNGQETLRRAAIRDGFLNDVREILERTQLTDFASRNGL